MFFLYLIFLASGCLIHSGNVLSEGDPGRDTSYAWQSLVYEKPQEDIKDIWGKQNKSDIDVKEKNQCPLQKAEAAGPSVNSQGKE